MTPAGRDKEEEGARTQPLLSGGLKRNHQSVSNLIMPPSAASGESQPLAAGSSSDPAARQLAGHRSEVAWWTHELSYSSLASNDSGYTTQPWLPDELSVHCMQCARPFHLLRWTHHCRDCGGLFCAACSTHRVETPLVSAATGRGPDTLRLCDNCAFSASHPCHVGCENPFGCERCGAPQTNGQLLVYLQLAVRLLLCCGACCTNETCWCIGSGCVTALDERCPPPPYGAARMKGPAAVESAPATGPPAPADKLLQHA